MKKYALFLIILITVSCDKPDQFTSVEGYVTDYYSKEPVSDIPLKITEYRPFLYPSVDTENTVLSNSDGYYYYEFFNKEDRSYEIEALQTETYYSSTLKKNFEGKTNTINFAVKPFKNLTLNCFNQNNTFNYLNVFSYLDNRSYIYDPCEQLTVLDLKIVPEQRNDFYIGASHFYEEYKADTSKGEYLRFVASINDTTINYYY
ncbi:MAG: hypothetical protein JXA77_01245 [Bacteroidales bacterium]|nr:hypothetical protein [Bacteroidales bacterium]